jgi:hypothetical protein
MPTFDEGVAAMQHQLLTDAPLDTAIRRRPPNADYPGRHRSARNKDLCRPGTLVVELNSRCPSSVIGQVDATNALVRHVGTCDDHVTSIADLVPFADGVRVRLGADFSSED